MHSSVACSFHDSQLHIHVFGKSKVQLMCEGSVFNLGFGFVPYWIVAWLRYEENQTSNGAKEESVVF